MTTSTIRYTNIANGDTMPGKMSPRPKPAIAGVTQINRPNTGALDVIKEVVDRIESGEVLSLVVVGTMVGKDTFCALSLPEDRDDSLAGLIGELEFVKLKIVRMLEDVDD